jgi:hypothetical protein
VSAVHVTITHFPNAVFARIQYTVKQGHHCESSICTAHNAVSYLANVGIATPYGQDGPGIEFL